jgi:NADH dehydrogenase [ubiquinone] 1 alpha subcomplex assembly factor 5
MEISRIQEKQKKLLFDRKKLLHSRNRSKSFTVKNEIYDHTSVNICERIDEINRVFQSTLVLTKNKNFERVIEEKLFKKIENQPIIVGPAGIIESMKAPLEDEENIDFKKQKFDLIISDLLLHTSNNLNQSLTKLHSLLKPDGLLVSTLFGGETLKELKNCLITVEEQLTGTIYPRINPFIDVRTAGDILYNVGFKLCVADSNNIKLSHNNLNELISIIRSMGENNYLNLKAPNIDRATWKLVADLYVNQFSLDKKLASTFNIITLTGWKYHHDQPEPLKPGSANISLSSVLKK